MSTGTGPKPTMNSISKDSLSKMFAGAAPKKKSSSCAAEKENIPIGYQQANKVMALHMQRMKAESVSAKRQIDTLRAENLRLTEKIEQLECAALDDRVELVLNSRLKRKVGQLVQIATRTITYIDKARQDFEAALSSMRADIDFDDVKDDVGAPPRRRLALSSELDRVEESPVRLVEPSRASTSTVRAARKSARRRSTLLDREEVAADPDETPRAAPARKGKRSLKTPRAQKAAATTPLDSGEDELVTPRVSSRKKAELEALPETPMDFPDPFIETETVRRRRQAALRIKTFVLPNLITKMRRPGKYDEPSPYIS